jgi:hypothetical protein
MAPELQLQPGVTTRRIQMTRRLLGCGFAGALALTAVSLGAQSAQAPSYPAQPPATAAAVTQSSQVTVEGCLRHELEAHARKVPERQYKTTVADEDYVLTDTKMIKGSEPQPDKSAKTDQDRPTGTSGTTPASLMFKVKGSNLHLADNVNHRVQIDGTFEHEKNAKNPPDFAFDLVRLNGTSIRQVPGDCPEQK